MKLTKEIMLTPYAVEYYDLREAKPRKAHPDTVIIDGGRISALHRLGLTVRGYIARQYEDQGCSIGSISKGKTYTIQADLNALWATYGPTDLELTVSPLRAGLTDDAPEVAE